MLRATATIRIDNVTVVDEIRKMGLEILKQDLICIIGGDLETVKLVEDMDGVENFMLEDQCLTLC